MYSNAFVGVCNNWKVFQGTHCGPDLKYCYVKFYVPWDAIAYSSYTVTFVG